LKWKKSKVEKKMKLQQEGQTELSPKREYEFIHHLNRGRKTDILMTFAKRKGGENERAR